MGMQAKLNKQGLNHIRAIKYAMTRLWESACQFDGINPTTKFVVFSEDNKFAELLDKARGQHSEVVNQYRAGGYVGLRIGQRRV